MKLYLFALFSLIACNINKMLNLYPCTGNKKMKRLMRAYKENSKATGGIVEYYNANRDLRILLDLLATNYGMGRAMAAMTLFDTVIFMTQFNTQYHNYLLKLISFRISVMDSDQS